MKKFNALAIVGFVLIAAAASITLTDSYITPLPHELTHLAAEVGGKTLLIGLLWLLVILPMRVFAWLKGRRLLGQKRPAGE
jgi:hypothetical protein